MGCCCSSNNGVECPRQEFTGTWYSTDPATGKHAKLVVTRDANYTLKTLKESGNMSSQYSISADFNGAWEDSAKEANFIAAKVCFTCIMWQVSITDDGALKLRMEDGTVYNFRTAQAIWGDNYQMLENAFPINMKERANQNQA